MKKLLLTMALFTCFGAWAEPGGIYTLTGEEQGMAEIIKADMAKFPELYKGESLAGYSSKFKKRNKIGKRSFAPGDPLYFPETMASRRAEKMRIAEEKSKAKERKKQQERLLKERIDSFTEKNETDWMPNAVFREFMAEAEQKGFFTDRYRVTEVDGRCTEDGNIEYRIKYEPIPNEGRYEWSWWYQMDEEFFEEKKELNEAKGLKMMHEQSYTLSTGEIRYQAVWYKHEV